jgi:ADP-ribose pyrophosphatase
VERDKPLGPWPLIDRVPLGDFKVFRVRKDVSRSPRTGLPHDFFVLDGNDWVNVVALTPERRIVLVRQYRHGRGSETLEIPGGSVEQRDPSPLVAAKRELREETGFEAERWKLLGVVDPNPAVQSNVCSTYLAENAVRVGDPTPDGGEDLRVETHRVDDIDTLVKEGRIRHALVLAAFHWFRLEGGRR